MRRAAIWPAIAGAVVAGGLALDAVGLPSSYLFAALLLGLAIALSRPDRVALPPLAFRASQAIAGVTLGAYLQAEALKAVAGSLAPVLLVSAGTLGLSLAAGAVLARTTRARPADGGARDDRRRRLRHRRHVRASSAPTTGSSRSCSTCGCSSWCC